MELPRVRADDVLAQPTRARLFSLLAELGHAASTDDLATRLGLHPNGVRSHLGLLEDAGLVRKTKHSDGPGRPRFEWSAIAGAGAPGDRPSAYQDLARWLARSIKPDQKQINQVEAAGRKIGHEQAGIEPGAAGLPGLESTLAVLGFRPDLTEEQGGATICLGNCPYADAASENPPIVCALHRGMTVGLLDELLPHSELADFVARDPDRAGCTIRLTAPAAG